MGITSRESTLAIGYSFPIIGAVLVTLRFLCRWQKNAPFRVDDWLCLPAWAFVTGASVSLLVGLYKGAFFIDDQKEEAVELQHILAQVTASLVMFWLLANATIKFSILFFYRRIFTGSTFNILSWTLIAASAVWLIYTFLTWLLYCGTHIHADFNGPWDSCPIWGTDIQIGAFVFDSLIDFCLILLPIPFLWELHVRVRQKLLLVVVFMVGGLAFVAGLNNTVVQLIYLLNPESSGVEGSQEALGQGADLLFSNWPVIEVGVGLIACCLPTISLTSARMLSAMVLERWRSLSSWGSRNHRNVTEPRGEGAANPPAHKARSSSGEDWSESGRDIPLDEMYTPTQSRLRDTEQGLVRTEEGHRPQQTASVTRS